LYNPLILLIACSGNPKVSHDTSTADTSASTVDTSVNDTATIETGDVAPFANSYLFSHTFGDNDGNRGLSGPRAVIERGSRLCVADTSNHRISVWSPVFEW
jgi:hypothetical protein